MKKREFLCTLGGASLAAMFAPERLAALTALPATEMATRADLWELAA